MKESKTTKKIGRSHNPRDGIKAQRSWKKVFTISENPLFYCEYYEKMVPWKATFLRG